MKRTTLLSSAGLILLGLVSIVAAILGCVNLTEPRMMFQFYVGLACLGAGLSMFASDARV